MRKSKGLGSGFGALEHNHCSFYFLPESSNSSNVASTIRDVCTHEFLHILTPLNVHSREIEDFNFRVPVMSQHLWMYEGVTEYFSLLAQLQDKELTEEKFFKKIRVKMIQSAAFGTFSMTDMSKNVIESKKIPECLFARRPDCHDARHPDHRQKQWQKFAERGHDETPAEIRRSPAV
jgi:hypothetical protein